MAELVLNAPRVVAGIDQGVAAAVVEHVARVDDITLVEIPIGETGPRQINAYFIELKNFDTIDGKKFKLEPQRSDIASPYVQTDVIAPDAIVSTSQRHWSSQ